MYTNRAKGWLCTAVAILVYIIPLIVLAIINRDKFTVESTLSLFSVVWVAFIVIFAKKTVKKVCGILTPIGFGSLLVLIFACALRSFLNDLFVIALASVIGSVVAWYPTQLAVIFEKNATDTDGNLRADLTFKKANKMLFAVKI